VDATHEAIQSSRIAPQTVRSWRGRQRRVIRRAGSAARRLRAVGRRMPRAILASSRRESRPWPPAPLDRLDCGAQASVRGCATALAPAGSAASSELQPASAAAAVREPRPPLDAAPASRASAPSVSADSRRPPPSGGEQVVLHGGCSSREGKTWASCSDLNERPAGAPGSTTARTRDAAGGRSRATGPRPAPRPGYAPSRMIRPVAGGTGAFDFATAVECAYYPLSRVSSSASTVSRRSRSSRREALAIPRAASRVRAIPVAVASERELPYPSRAQALPGTAGRRVDIGPMWCRRSRRPCLRRKLAP